ncbi:MAG: PaaI family thioesterase [Ruminiclostridium sp.]|nr:PaaI family thioesterase [Ruminiclostridium sp.]
MKQLNQEHISALLALINSGPYFELLDMKVRELGTGYSKVEVDLQRKHFNPFGAIHGGVYSSIIDTAAYWSVYCELDENIGFTSIDLSVSNLSMIREGKIIVEGKSIKIGRSLCLAEAKAIDTDGKLLAHGTSKLMILNGKQSIKHAIEAMGYRTLPPKFID